MFVAAHVNMHGTVSPSRYPGGQERAEAEKKANFAYLERMCEFWPVGHNWVCLFPSLLLLAGKLTRQWRTVQEASEFYKTARHPGRPGQSTLAGTLDEYGDIRSSRPEQSTTRRAACSPVAPAESELPLSGLAMDHELEDMLQWPFIDETWSVGFDAGFDTAWTL